MAKISEKELTDISQDWGNDGTGLPYSGNEVQKFIKNELSKRPDREGSKIVVTEELQSQLFGGGSRKLVTAIEGTSEALTITSLDSEGNETSETLEIGTPDVNDRIVTITSRLTNPYINVGGQTSLVYGYSVTDYQGDIIENQLASASITLSRQEASQPFYTANLGNIGSTTEVGLTNQVLDLTNIIAENIKNSAKINATLVIQYTYSFVNDEGITVTKTIRKSRTVSIEVLTLTLSVPYNISNINDGQLSLQYTVKGNGSKNVTLYKNGVVADSVEEITNNSYAGVFIVDITSTANYQIVAETKAGTTTVKSSSFYFDVIGPSSGRVIAIKYEDTTGTIQNESTYQSPIIEFPKFNNFKFDYFVYNPNASQSDLEISTKEVGPNGNTLVEQKSNQQVDRNIYSYSKRVKSSNKLVIELTSGNVDKVINVLPMTTSIDLDVPTDSLILNLESDGRSNSEANPQEWSYGEYSTQFTKVNWQSNGWIDDNGMALVLKNGAKAVINYPLFQYINNQPVTSTGCTFEILFKCSNPTLDTHDIITCNWAGSQGRTTGLKITTNYVGVNTGTVTEYKDDDGNVTQTVEDAVGSQYAVDTYYKYAFVIDPNLGTNGLCLGYLDGILSFVSDIPSVFANNTNVPITIDSSYADVYVKSIKYYSKALTSDECVNDYIIDQTDLNTIEALYNKNSILGINNLGNTYVSPSKIRAMGKGVMIISPSSSQPGETVNITDLNKSSDKKSYYGPFRVDYFAPESDLNLGYQTVPTKGNPFNFTHTECAIRIQGTTSTKRPRKNFRLHYNKKDGNNKPSKGSFIVGGEVRDNFKYAMSQNSVAVPITCLKVDYVDSSMTHNTGGALVYNEMVKAVSSMWNPAQQHEYNTTGSIKTRVAIEGFPIDVFQATRVINPDYTDNLDDTNYEGLLYMGQYNFNNDKSKSGNVFGFDGSYTYDEDGEYSEDGKYQPICIEFLDNTKALDSFQVTFNNYNEVDEEATFNKTAFAAALEVRAPADITDFVADYGLDELAISDDLKDGDEAKGEDSTPNTYKYVPGQIKRVFKFVGECAAEVAASNNIANANSLNSYTSAQLDALDWSSNKFKTLAADYFNLSNICGWYIWTDYTLAVDQRAKNMMLYTMDGKHWMLQYYDGDTMMGERNDCFLAYDYLTDRDTWDYAVKQYAFQGHDSWLWHLIRANFSDLLDTTCQQMRSSGKFSPQYFKSIFDTQIVGSWSQRQYNYSQEYKYIKPLTETGYPSDIGTNFINTAQGSRQAHRDYLIDNRFSLLDSKYQAGNYADDNYLYYGAEGMVQNKVKIVSSIPFYFGYKTPNTPLTDRQYANESNNYTVHLNVVGNTTNNPASILGASKIKELYIGESGNDASWSVDSTKPLSLPNLQKLVAINLGSNVAGSLYLPGCNSLAHLDLHGCNFSGLYRLDDSAKLKYLDVSNTGITSARIADGCPIEYMKISNPSALFLSNLDNLTYQGKSTDTLIVEDWDNLEQLVVNNCPNIEWELLVDKLVSSPVSNKWLRVTGLSIKKNITWLDKFISTSDVTWAGLDSNGNEVQSVQLVGNLYLPSYTDDAVVASYQVKFPSLTIHQPEYTMIETDETVADETPGSREIAGSTTNLDNNTGYRTSTMYTPSGHISKILGGCHRYLGKLLEPGNLVDLVGNPSDTDPLGKSFKGRDMNGTMMLCQLADSNSTFFNEGYNSTNRREANLDGLKGHGEVYVKIPGFWYKGINYNPAEAATTKSWRYTCYSTNKEKPSVSSEIKVLPISELLSSLVEEGHTNGLYRNDYIVAITNGADNISDRLTQQASNDVIRIDVEGYKKVRYPASIGTRCSVFTDADGEVITDDEGSVVNVGELKVLEYTWLYDGMPVIATIPDGAKYLYITVSRYHDTSSITCDPSDVVLHKGSKFTSGAAMNDSNAAEWIADMEPDWLYSEPVCIGAAPCSADSEANLYTSFNGTKGAVRGTSRAENPLNSKSNWFQYRFRESACNRGLQLIDYEASKLIAMLFIARYGRRNSQNELGYGDAVNSNIAVGTTRTYGMTDTVKSPADYLNSYILAGTYINVGHATFLGIEDVFLGTPEFLDRAYFANETAADCMKIRITNPDLSTRRLYSLTNYNKYIRSLAHGKHCDIVACSSTSGTSATYYSDTQNRDGALRAKWSSTKAILRSYHRQGPGNEDAGVFFLDASPGVGYSDTYYGSRLLFRGNIVETTDIDEFLDTEEWRGQV